MKIHAAEIHPKQFCAAQVGPEDFGLTEVCSSESGPDEFGLVAVCSNKFRFFASPTSRSDNL
jgi:hypothetical protein